MYVRNIKERLCNVKNTWIVTNEIYDTPACKCYFKHKEMGLFFVTDHFDLNNLQKKPSTCYCWKSWLSVSTLVRSHRSKRSRTVLLNPNLFSVDFVDTNFKWYEFQVYESSRICNKLMSSESLQVIITLICKGEK